MPRSDTPPSSPQYPQMDDGEDEFIEVNEDELEEILDLHGAQGAVSDDDDDDEDAFDDEPVLGPPPERDDASLVFSNHTSMLMLIFFTVSLCVIVIFVRISCKSLKVRIILIKFLLAGSLFCCHIDPAEGKLAVSGGQDDKAYVWEIDSGKVVLECTGHQVSS